MDSETGILTISASSDFANDYKDETRHLAIGGEVTEIPARAFENWVTLISADIGGSVASIGNYAFNECNNLEVVNINGSVSSI